MDEGRTEADREYEVPSILHVKHVFPIAFAVVVLIAVAVAIFIINS
jgi:hypothetical protein